MFARPIPKNGEAAIEQFAAERRAEAARDARDDSRMLGETAWTIQTAGTLAVDTFAVGTRAHHVEGGNLNNDYASASSVPAACSRAQRSSPAAPTRARQQERDPLTRHGVALDGGDARCAGGLDQDADRVHYQGHRGSDVVVVDEHNVIAERSHSLELAAIGSLIANPPAIVLDGSLRSPCRRQPRRHLQRPHRLLPLRRRNPLTWPSSNS